MRFVQKLRSSCGGSLSSMAQHNVVHGVAQLILDHQVRGPHRPEAAHVSPNAWN